MEAVQLKILYQPLEAVKELSDRRGSAIGLLARDAECLSLHLGKVRALYMPYTSSENSLS